MLTPLGHRVLVKSEDIEHQTPAGIVLVEDERLKKAGQMRGVIVAVGDQAWKAFDKEFNGKPWAKPGDIVIYARYAGKEVEDPTTGETFIVMNDEDIVLKISEGENVQYEAPYFPKTYLKEE